MTSDMTDHLAIAKIIVLFMDMYLLSLFQFKDCIPGRVLLRGAGVLCSDSMLPSSLRFSYLII